jgi:phage host-nuclease inhibitor protein Gam
MFMRMRMHTANAVPSANDQSSANLLPVTNVHDAEVDMEVLKAVPKAFAIEDEKSANWLIKRIVSARQYAARVKEWAEQELRRADREEKTLMHLFGRQIEGWAREEIDKLKGKRKSINLPAGAVGFRTVKPCLQVDDEAFVIRWASENLPAAVVTVQKLSRSALKDHFAETGDMPPEGVHVDPGGDRFFIG